MARLAQIMGDRRVDPLWSSRPVSRDQRDGLRVGADWRHCRDRLIRRSCDIDLP